MAVVKPTARELIATPGSLGLLVRRVERVLKLHQPAEWDGREFCTHCHTWYPCATVRVLNGKTR